MKLRARDIMTGDPACVHEDDTLQEAAKQLAKRAIGAMPICGNDDRLKGMLTDRDIVVKAVARGWDAATTRAGDLAEGKPVTIGADDSIFETLRTMAKHDVRRLPVIDGHRLIGIVSQADVARNAPKRLTGELVRAISAAPPDTAGRRRRIGGVPVLGLAVVPLVVAGVALARKAADGGSGAIEARMDVDVPVRTAYDQWTQFEEFPRFMNGVEEVRQLDDTHLHWVASVAGRRREWDAEIVEQVPDTKIAWRSTSGTRNAGLVQFTPLGADRTRIEVRMEHEADGILETVGGTIGLDGRRVRADLGRFRDLVEARRTPTGAWRGTVHGGQPV